MKLLVVGGAGYIGSHMLKVLYAAGHELLTLDNLSTGHRDAVLYGEFVQGDLADTDFLQCLFRDEKVAGVFHFASSIQVGESMKKPCEYYRNNVVNTLNLLDAMVAAGIDKFIFSSTAAVYGVPLQVPINETHPIQPISPYGKSKAMVESVLADYFHAYGLRSVCLRYFNAAGADPDGDLGERHDPETHLIPLVLQAASGRRKDLTVYGRNYATPDGTCIRDYVHVEDLCVAHLLAWQHLCSGGLPEVFNLGSGQGFSVQQVIDVVRRVTRRPFNVQDGQRRKGDPDVLIASSDKARKELNWKPRRTDLEYIIADAWLQERKLCGEIRKAQSVP